MTRAVAAVVHRGPGAIALVLCGLAAAAPASAQEFDPGLPGPYVIDARGAITGVPNAFTLLLLTPDDAVAPPRGLGIDIGGHVYPVSLGPARLGIGASVLYAWGSASPPVSEIAGAAAGPGPPVVDTRITIIAPQVSLNFGTGEGWSYLSGGAGWGKAEASIAAPRAGATAGIGWGAMLNYGGGVRWFLSRRLAFGLDLRVHQFQGRDVETSIELLPRTTLMTATVGVSVR